MDPRLIIIAAALFVAAMGYVCLAPDQFAFLRLPQAFLALGAERIVTGLSLMLLGFLVALSELPGQEKQAPARRGQPFAFGEDDLVLAGEPAAEPSPPPPADPTPAAVVESAQAEPVEPSPVGKRRPDLYVAPEQDAPPAVPESDSPPVPPEP